MGKLQAARTLLDFARYLRNWRDVWAAYRRGDPVPGPLLLRNGLRIEFGPEDDPIQVFREVFVRACYTPRWFYRPRPGDVVIDLGANIGVFSLAVAARGVRCHSFEPAAATRAKLTRNVELNRLTDVVRIYPLATAGERGTMRLNSGVSSIYGSLLATDRSSGATEEPVQVVTLADALRLTGEPRVDLLKIDIEGAEKDLFDTTSPAVFAGVRRVALEYHEAARPGTRAAVVAALRAAGFRVSGEPGVSPTAGCGLLYGTRG